MVQYLIKSECNCIEGVKGAVTFSAPRLMLMTSSFIETVLASNGFRLEKNGNIYKVSLLRVGDPLPQVLGQDVLTPGQTEVAVRNTSRCTTKDQVL